MKIEVGASIEAIVEYNTLRNISFAPSADIINDRLSVTEVSLDVVTDDTISVGVNGWLYDDDNALWFHGYISYAEEEQEHVAHVRIRSELGLLDNKIIKAGMYNTNVEYMLDEVFTNTEAWYIASQSILQRPITGYCPEQTARERLQHVLFAAGLYCRDSFSEHPVIAEIDTQNVREIPRYKTYWKPTLVAEEYVTAVRVTAYAFTMGTPTDEDEYVEVDGYKYIISKTEVKLNNPNVPPNTPENEVVYDSVYIINSNNVSSVASTLALYYFNRQKVDFECINCGEYFLGEKYQVAIHEGENTADYAIGYAESCDFSFGIRQKSRMTIGACTVVQLDKLIVEYIGVEAGVQGMILGRRTYFLPANASYEVTADYLSATLGSFAYVFRPASPTISGVKSEGAETVRVNAYIALKTNLNTRVLEIVSVDSVERVEEGTGGDLYYLAEIE